MRCNWGWIRSLNWIFGNGFVCGIWIESGRHFFEDGQGQNIIRSCRQIGFLGEPRKYDGCDYSQRG